MEPTLVLAFGLLAAVARRVDGGWTGVNKSAAVALLVSALCAPSFVQYFPLENWATVFGVTLPHLVRQLLTVLVALFYVQGGIPCGFTQPRTLVLRYGLPGALLGALYGFWPAALLGVWVAACTAVGRRFWPDPSHRLPLPWDTPTQQMFDSIWEGLCYEFLGVGFGGGVVFSAAVFYGMW